MNNEIWTSRNCGIWYSEHIDDNCVLGYASYCEVEKFVFINKKDVCEYCGHEKESGIECPGCAARKTKLGKLAAGKASIKIAGLMPKESWLLRSPSKIELHIRDCGRADFYENCIGKITIENIISSDKYIDGLSYSIDEVIRVHTTFEGDVSFEGEL